MQQETAAEDMPLDEDEWNNAMKMDGMRSDALDVLKSEYPSALTKSEIMNRWDRPQYPNDSEILGAVLEVMVAEGETEVAKQDGVAGFFYRFVEE